MRKENLVPVDQDRSRARDIGIRPGILQAGEFNGITDVPGVKVGHSTIRLGRDVRTGVTAILPHNGNTFRTKVPAGVYVGNGFGKLIGITQVQELGYLESPIVLTNTLSVWRAAEAVADFVLAQRGNEQVQSVNVVVGETNDGILNDIRRVHVEKAHVLEALTGASSGIVSEGSVGAGTGTVAFGFKGGIGTSSRLILHDDVRHSLGVLVQTNFGGLLVMDGLPIGRDLNHHFLDGNTGDGSVMIVVATDAPLDARQLTRLAKRAMLGISRTGSPIANGSGDYAIAFSVASLQNTTRTKDIHVRDLADDELTPMFQAAVEATEEAVYNSLLMATTTTGFKGVTIESLPLSVVERSMITHRYHSNSAFRRY